MMRNGGKWENGRWKYREEKEQPQASSLPGISQVVVAVSPAVPAQPRHQPRLSCASPFVRSCTTVWWFTTTKWNRWIESKRWAIRWVEKFVFIFCRNGIFFWRNEPVANNSNNIFVVFSWRSTSIWVTCPRWPGRNHGPTSNNISCFSVAIA